jgi:hypothetical protein
MLRFIMGLTIGVILVFQAPRYARRCREMCHSCFEYFHSEAHREEYG